MSEPSAQPQGGAPPPPSAGGRHRRAPEPTTRAETGDRRTRSWLRTLTLIVAALCLPAAAALMVFLVRSPATSTVTTLTGPTSQAAENAARTAAGAILSYDYRTLPANIKRAQADTTGEFSKQYSSTSAALLKQAKQEKAIVRATVGSAGVVSTSPTNVVVLLFVDQASVRQPTGQKSPTTRIDQSRVRMTMSLVGGRWLVAQLQAL